MNPLKKIIFLYGMLLLTIIPVRAQTDAGLAEEMLKKYGEVYLWVPVTKASDLQYYSRIASLDAVYRDSARICLKKSGYDQLVNTGIAFSVYKMYRPPVKKGISLWQGWNTYPTYPQYDSVMHAFATAYPSLCRLDTIGSTPGGRQLLAVKISDNVSADEAEPEFMYSSTIHGDETGGYVLMLRLINYLLERYPADTLVQKLVDGLEIWICPLANPDGTYRGGDNTVSGAWRYNASGVDLNRNFPDPEDGLNPDGNVHQPETQAMIAFHSSRHIGMSANFHAGEEVVNYPWDTWSRYHADDAWFRLISRIYADTAHSHSTGYMTGFDNGITNGYAWYSISGGRQDYVTYFHQGRETTIELDYTKITPESELDTLWEYNFRSLLYYMREAIFGLEGFVTDSVTGQPVKAMIFIPGHDLDSSQVFSDSVFGYYHRYLAAGTYDLQVTANGYLSKTIANVNIQDHTVTSLDIHLSPLDNGLKGKEKNSWLIYPNPAKTNSSFTVIPPYTGNYAFRLISVGGVVVLHENLYGTAGTPFRISLPHDISAGIYILGISDAGNTTFLRLSVIPE